MAATLATTPPRGDGWAWELKWDGIRALGYVDGGRIRLFTRNGSDVSHRYPELRQVGVELGTRDAVLDGEIVAFDDDGRPSFELLQRRMHVDERHRDPQAGPTKCPSSTCSSTCCGSTATRSCPNRTKNGAPNSLDLGLTGASWQTPPHEVGDGAATRDVSERFGLEGVVAKRLDSIYEPGRRSRAWLKLKNTIAPGVRRRRLDARREGPHGQHRLAADRLLRRRRPLLRGTVGSGLRQQDLTELERLFERCARDTSPFTKGAPPKGARWVEPVLVVDVKFANWTAAGGIRAPVFLGYRTDKDPEEVVRE